MPSPRRVRLLVLAAIVTVVFVLFYTSGVDSREGSFMDKTLKAMHPQGQSIINTRTGEQAGHIPADTDADGDIDADDIKAKEDLKASLQKTEKVALDNANKKSPVKPDPPSKVVGKGNSRDGQAKDVKPAADDSESKNDAVKEAASPFDAKKELKRILDKAPGKTALAHFFLFLYTLLIWLSLVVIFSKTYCPHSKMAKNILREKYNIDPAPFVFELNLLDPDHTSALQKELKAKTGRSTVPNILIKGVSIGGADLVEEMDRNDELEEKIRTLGKPNVKISHLLEPASGHH